MKSSFKAKLTTTKEIKFGFEVIDNIIKDQIYKINVPQRISHEEFPLMIVHEIRNSKFKGDLHIMKGDVKKSLETYDGINYLIPIDSTELDNMHLEITSNNSMTISILIESKPKIDTINTIKKFDYLDKDSISCYIIDKNNKDKTLLITI